MNAKALLFKSDKSSFSHSEQKKTTNARSSLLITAEGPHDAFPARFLLLTCVIKAPQSHDKSELGDKLT